LVSPPGNGNQQQQQTKANSTKSSGAFSTESYQSEPHQERVIVVANQLPLKMTKLKEKNEYGHSWDIEADGDSVFDQMREGILDDGDFKQVINVGMLPSNASEINSAEEEALTVDLLQRFFCVPVMMDLEVRERHYKGFCKEYLWNMMHYVLPMGIQEQRFEKSLWQAHVGACKTFADTLMEVVSSEDDHVWIQDYHLMILPTFLRKRFNSIRCMFFLHTPFPSSEIFRTLPNRELILRGLLNADVVGFHTFDYARHFLSCCTRLLGLTYTTNRGSLCIDYYGRQVSVKICPTGVKTDRLREALISPGCLSIRSELLQKYHGKRILLAIDDFDVFKGIELKLQAFQTLLKEHPDLTEKIVLLQICNPARAKNDDVTNLRAEVKRLIQEINAHANTEVVIFREQAIPLQERVALYSIADVSLVTVTRDGMNLAPYEYVTCRQGPEDEIKATRDGYALPRQSSLIVSEFTGVSPSLSGAFRVNPWDVDDVADVVYKALSLSEKEAEMRHEKHWKYVGEHNVSFWAKSCLNELQRTCARASSSRSYGLGFGLNFRVVQLDSSFRKLDTNRCVGSYQKAKKRKLFIDYDGTLVTLASFNQPPTAHLANLLTSLAADQSNTLCIVSGREKATLDEWFGNVPNISLVAEHGYWYRGVDTNNEWIELAPPGTDIHVAAWKETVLPILEQYMEATDGSFIQAKESSFVWHYRDADADFGNWQAKELVDHLEGALEHNAVDVRRGNNVVEITAQDVNKRLAVDRVLSREQTTDIDFILSIGDDRSDEEMFIAIENRKEMDAAYAGCSTWCSTVGQKPSKAPYYVDDVEDVLMLLQALAQFDVCHIR
jgi:trehalose 6-phosphate synthase/phosphatase